AKQKDMNINKNQFEKTKNLGSQLAVFKSASTKSVQNDLTALVKLWDKIQRMLTQHENDLSQALKNAPPNQYLEAIKALTQWIENVEAVLKSESFQVTEVDVLEDKLERYQELQQTLKSQKGNFDYVCTTGADLVKSATSQQRAEVLQSDINSLTTSWSNVSSSVQERSEKLEKAISDVRQWQDEVDAIEVWMKDVEDFLQVEEPALGDIETLEAQLEQSLALQDDIHDTLQPNMTSINEAGSKLTQEGAQAYALKITTMLAQLNDCWQRIKHLAKDQKDTLEKSLKRSKSFKDSMVKLLDWIDDIENEYVSKELNLQDPADIQNSLRKYQKINDELKEKEKDIDAIISTGKPIVLQAAVSVKETLSREMEILNERWKSLKENIQNRYKMMSEASESWKALKKLLEEERSWITEFEKEFAGAPKFGNSADLADELTELREDHQKHVVVNRAKIQEHTKYLLTHRIMVTSIEREIKEYNQQVEDVTSKLQDREKALADTALLMKQTDNDIKALDQWLLQVNKTLDQRLVSNIVAADVPEEFMKLQTDLSQHENKLEKLNRGVRIKAPPGSGLSQQQLQQKVDGLKKRMEEIQFKFRRFQKPADFEPKMAHVKNILDSVDKGVSVISLKNGESEVIQSQLDACMGFYKSLSEVKPGVEYVIKTGRQIVDKKQVENPQDLTEKLNTLKQQYNILGKKVTDGKMSLEKGLKLSRSFKKEMVSLNDWLKKTEVILDSKDIDGKMPDNLEAELKWSQHC
uniref:Dystrophin-like n=1 Tax=Saccoglossus kowalevskii TaxID=10224 RepID=A0ABM0LUL5_SACKO